MRMGSVLLAASLVVAALGLSGCLQTCNTLCVENARYVDGCLETWDALWIDFGYDGRNETDGTTYEGGPAEEYVVRCQARYDTTIAQSGPEAGRTIREGCAADLQGIAAAVNCEDYEPNDDTLNPNE